MLNSAFSHLPLHLEDLQRRIASAYVFSFTVPDHPRLPAILLPDDKEALAIALQYLKGNSALELYTWVEDDDDEILLLQGDHLDTEDYDTMALALVDKESLMTMYAEIPEYVPLISEPESN